MAETNDVRMELYKQWYKLAQPYFQWQFLQFRPYLGRRVADIGCGLGNFSDILMDRDVYVGVDSDPHIIEAMRTKFRDRRNMRFLHDDATDPGISVRLKSWKIDSVLCVNLIEHIEDDVSALDHMVQCLPRNRYLCLLVPAFSFNYGTLDYLDGHFRRYDKRSVKNKLRGLPVDIATMYYFNILGGIGWFLKGRVFREKNQAAFNYRATNTVIPVMSVVERLIKPLYGLSLIVICRKK